MIHTDPVTVRHNESQVKGKRITVTECAGLLGIHRVYLSNVIHGLFSSKRLMRRIRKELTPDQRAALRKAQSKTESRPSKPKI
jgi:hypothetical protein